MTEEFLREINRLIESGTLEPFEANKLMLAEITLLNRRLVESEGQQRQIIDRLDAVLKNQEEQKDLARRIGVLEDVAVRVDELEEARKRYDEYPTLTYLLRYHPRQTIVVLVAVFMALSMWWVSGFRMPLLKWLGLPVF